jgi:hypothetical protein
LEKRRPDAMKRTLDIANDQRCVDLNDTISGALERNITAGVSPLALAVIRAIDLNHEALRGSQEVCDEAPE